MFLRWLQVVVEILEVVVVALYSVVNTALSSVETTD